MEASLKIIFPSQHHSLSRQHQLLYQYSNNSNRCSSSNCRIIFSRWSLQLLINCSRLLKMTHSYSRLFNSRSSRARTWISSCRQLTTCWLPPRLFNKLISSCRLIKLPLRITISRYRITRMNKIKLRNCKSRLARPHYKVKRSWRSKRHWWDKLTWKVTYKN